MIAYLLLSPVGVPNMSKFVNQGVEQERASRVDVDRAPLRCSMKVGSIFPLSLVALE
jgi:hypothetical protein